MSETFEFTCPECSKTIQLPTAIVGKRGKCPSCGAAVLIQNQAPFSTETPLSQPAPPLTETPLPQPDPISGSAIPASNPLGAPGTSSPPPLAPASGDLGVAPLNPLGPTPASPFNSLEEIQSQGKKKRLFNQQPFPGSLFSYSIEVVRDNVSVQAIMDSADFSRVISNLLLAINTVLILVVGVVALCFSGNYQVLMMGIPAAFALVLLSYVNNRSLEGIRTIVKDEFTISTTAFFDIVSACLIAILYFTPLLLCHAIFFERDLPTVLGVVGGGVLAFYCAVVTINPSSLGFKQAQNATTADDAIGLTAYFVKVCSSAVPYIYLLANVACIGVVLLALVGPFFAETKQQRKSDDNGEYIYESGSYVMIDVYGFSDKNIWESNAKFLPYVPCVLAFPFVMYLYGLISLASVYVVKAIVDSARYLKNSQRW